MRPRRRASPTRSTPNGAATTPSRSSRPTASRPVWIIGLLVPRDNYPAQMQAGGHEDDLISLAFAFENLMLAARAEGLGTVPTTAFQRFEKDRLREILGLPEHIDPAIVSPLGFPEEWPEGLAPALQRNFKSWKTLVHDEQWGQPGSSPSRRSSLEAKPPAEHRAAPCPSGCQAPGAEPRRSRGARSAGARHR